MTTSDDAVGLHVDMLDVDRLRDWARLLLVHGADIGHWASVPHLASKMQTLATGLEKTVRDVGILRGQRDELLAELRNIANAKPSAWDKDMRDQFQPWAQNRARHAIAKVLGLSLQDGDGSVSPRQGHLG
jgi:hypothetical protein